MLYYLETTNELIQPGFCDRFENRGERDGDIFDAKYAANGYSICKNFAEENVPYLSTNSKSYCKFRVSRTGNKKNPEDAGILYSTRLNLYNRRADSGLGARRKGAGFFL